MQQGVSSPIRDWICTSGIGTLESQPLVSQGRSKKLNMTFNYWCYIQVASQKLILFLKIYLLIWRGFLGTECANYDFISSFPILSVFNFMVSLHQNHECITDCYQVVLVLCHCSWFTQSDSNVFTFWIMFVGGSVVDMLYEVYLFLLLC